MSITSSCSNVLVAQTCRSIICTVKNIFNQKTALLGGFLIENVLLSKGHRNRIKYGK